MNDWELVEHYLDHEGRRVEFLCSLLRLYEQEQKVNSVNPATTLSKRLKVNPTTLAGWVQRARKLRTLQP